MLSLAALASSVGSHHAEVWHCLKRHRIPFIRKNGKVFVRKSFRPAVKAFLRPENYALGFEAARSV